MRFAVLHPLSCRCNKHRKKKKKKRRRGGGERKEAKKEGMREERKEGRKEEQLKGLRQTREGCREGHLGRERGKGKVMQLYSNFQLVQFRM